MERYHVIHDLGQVERFYDLFIHPHQSDHTAVLLFMLARRKYDPSIITSNNRIPLERKLITQIDRNHFVNKIYEYELPLGRYRDKENNVISNEALALYCSLNQQCMLTAWRSLVSETFEHLMNLVQGKQSDFVFNKMFSRFKSLVHKAPSDKPYFELDVDTKEPQVISALLDLFKEVGTSIVASIETRGGYHIVVDNNSNNKNQLVQRLRSISPLIEYKKMPSPPIPGTLQGGFAVRFVDL